MPKLCDMHSSNKVISTLVDAGGIRDYDAGDVLCDDVAEWIVDDNEGNMFYVCTNHIGYVFHEKHKEYKVSPLKGGE